MSTFPCKECLVRAACSEYCNELIQEPKAIDIYVASLLQCPDCGSQLNPGSSFNKTTRICFTCSKAFNQDTFVKTNAWLTPNILSSSVKLENYCPPPISSKDSSNTRVITNLNPSKAKPVFSMKETHDVFYRRLSILQSQYIIRKINLATKSKIMEAQRKPKAKIPYPDWIDKYDVLFQESEELEGSVSFF